MNAVLLIIAIILAAVALPACLAALIAGWSFRHQVSPSVKPTALANEEPTVQAQLELAAQAQLELAIDAEQSADETLAAEDSSTERGQLYFGYLGDTPGTARGITRITASILGSENAPSDPSEMVRSPWPLDGTYTAFHTRAPFNYDMTGVYDGTRTPDMVRAADELQALALKNVHSISGMLNVYQFLRARCDEDVCDIRPLHIRECGNIFEAWKSVRPNPALFTNPNRERDSHEAINRFVTREIKA